MNIAGGLLPVLKATYFRVGHMGGTVLETVGALGLDLSAGIGPASLRSAGRPGCAS